MQQLAWLHAIPKTPQSQAVASRQALAPKSRLQKLLAEGGHPDLPEVSCGYLLDIFLEVGPVSAAGMGSSRITQAEIAHWQANMRTPLPPWECRTLLRLSEAWLEESRVADDAARPPPYAEAPTTRTRDKVARQVDALL